MRTRIGTLVDRLANLSALDRVAEPLTAAVRERIGHGPAKDALSGTWLRHPLHPMLTDIPIGSFTSASFLDLVGGRRARPAADALVALGLVTAAPTAAAGLSDWSDTTGRSTRIGLVHAVANAGGLALYAASLIARVRGKRAKGASLALAGMGVMTVGGYLGGHLSYERGEGVNNAFWQEPPNEWTTVLDDAELSEGKPVGVTVENASILLLRSNGTTRAIGSRCTHAGGPVHEGRVDATATCVTCPWHASEFRLRDGVVVHGPARVDVPAYDVRVVSGRIQVRVRTTMHTTAGA